MQLNLEFFVETFALIIMVVSLFGLIVPIFPGLVVIWLVAFISVLVTGGTAGWIVFLALTVLTIAGVLADNLLMGAKAREQGAAWASIGLALGAGVVGTLVVPPIGGLLAAPLVLYLMERHRLGDHDQAMGVVKALALGWGWAFVARFGIGALMIAIWGFWALSN